jgi:hypothetical protein
MLCHLKRRVLTRKRITSRVRFPTFHELLAVLCLLIDDLENLSCGSRNLSLYESVQPMPGLLDVLDPKNVFYQFYCVSLSMVTRPNQLESTYAIVAY